MNTYVIHYTKLQDRKQEISSILDNEKIKYKFVEEYDKEYIENNPYYLPDKFMFSHKVGQLWDSSIHKFRVLSPAEISCTIKHIRSWEKILNTDEEINLILEDDAIPTKVNLSNELQEILETVPDDWDCIFLGYGCGENYIRQKIAGRPLLNGRFVKVDHPSSNCTESFLIKKNTIRKIFDVVVPFQLVIDWELSYVFYKLNMNVYWTIPPLFQQGSKNGKYKSELR